MQMFQLERGLLVVQVNSGKRVSIPRESGWRIVGQARIDIEKGDRETITVRPCDTGLQGEAPLYFEIREEQVLYRRRQEHAFDSPRELGAVPFRTLEEALALLVLDMPLLRYEPETDDLRVHIRPGEFSSVPLRDGTHPVPGAMIQVEGKRVSVTVDGTDCRNCVARFEIVDYSFESGPVNDRSHHQVWLPVYLGTWTRNGVDRSLKAPFHTIEGLRKFLVGGMSVLTVEGDHLLIRENADRAHTIPLTPGICSFGDAEIRISDEDATTGLQLRISAGNSTAYFSVYGSQVQYHGTGFFASSANIEQEPFWSLEGFREFVLGDHRVLALRNNQLIVQISSGVERTVPFTSGTHMVPGCEIIVDQNRVRIMPLSHEVRNYEAEFVVIDGSLYYLTCVGLGPPDPLSFFGQYSFVREITARSQAREAERWHEGGI